jgi:hypothetical protein
MASLYGYRRGPQANKAGTRRSITSRRLFLLVVLGTVMALVGGGLGAWYATQGSGGSTAANSTQSASTQSGSRPTGPTLSHRAYALLYLSATLKKTRIGILKQWPSPPYQHYTSGKADCYEWWDKPIALYNLCFVKGVLWTKAIE